MTRGLYAFLHCLVNGGPALTRSQQKALCKQDPATGSWVVGGGRSRSRSSSTNQYQSWCDVAEMTALTCLTGDPRVRLLLMVGHTQRHRLALRPLAAARRQRSDPVHPSTAGELDTGCAA